MTLIINADSRKLMTKGATRALRQSGKVPAVIYGSKKDPIAIAMNGHDLLMVMQQGSFFTHIHTISVDGKEEKVLARDIQRNVINEVVEHVDFLRYDAKRELKVNVAVHFVDEDKSPGLKKGAILQVIRSEVELVCRADSIPESVEISIAGLDVGESVHISAATLPEGVRTAVDRDFTVASIVTTRTSKQTAMDEAPVGDEAAAAVAEAMADKSDEDEDEDKK